jgi:hypothetical protein
MIGFALNAGLVRMSLILSKIKESPKTARQL